MKSVFSRVMVAGVFVTASAGWVGVQATPADQAQAAPAEHMLTAAPSVRDRAAWQPSPIPGQSQPQPQTQSAHPAPSTAGAAAPSTRALTAPVSPVLTAPGVPSPFDRLGSWLRGLIVKPKPQPAERVEPLPGIGTDHVVPMTDLFNHDALEEVFEGMMPTQRGEWRHVTFFSRALGRESTYMTWLPPGYAASGRTYPTLYLLHGVGSPEAYGVEEWLGYSLTEDLDRMLALGLIEPMVVVLPNGEQSYWVNHANGPRWADYVAIDLVKHVDSTFRTETTREKRAIGGLSMGGHGAVQLAYNHPETFSVAGAHSPTIRPFETSPEFFGDAQYFAKLDPISLAKSGDAAMRVTTWIDVGEADEWRTGAQSLRDVLSMRRAPTHFRVLEGEHEGWYWRYYLPEYLHFYSKALNATAKTSHGAPVVASQLLTASGVSPSIAVNAGTHS